MNRTRNAITFSGSLLFLAAILAHAEPGAAGQKLIAGDAATYDGFGRSVAFADSGNTLLVGADRSDTGVTTDSGSVYLFRRTLDGSFSQDKKFTIPGSADGLSFGFALALSDTGDTALIGAPGAGFDKGAAFVFVQAVDESWSSLQLVPPDAADWDEFGSAVALSLDGNTALVGAPKDDTPGGGDAGSAHVWGRELDGSWTHQEQLFAPDGAAIDVFGSAVALSTTGNTALVGAPQDDTASGFTVGSAHVFVRAADGSWSHQSQFFAPDAAGGDRFGSAVALSPDGHTCLVGAPYDDTQGGTGAGSTHAFVHAGDGSWSHQAQMLAPEPIVSEGFGSALAFFAGGDAALIGSPFDDSTGGIDAGSAYLFERYGDGSWNFEARLLDGDGNAFDRFGRSVALSPSGGQALVGADDDDVGPFVDAGSASLIDLLDTDSDDLLDLVDPDDDNDGELDAVETHTGIFVDDSDLGTDPKALDSDGDNWDDGNERDYFDTDPTDPASTLDPYSGKLIVIDGKNNDFLGASVALSAAGDLSLIGAPHDDTAAGQNAGSARVFSRDVSGTWTHVETLLDPSAAGSRYFGDAVALSASGETALVGRVALSSSGPGYVQVFQQAGDGSWIHQKQLVAPDGVPSLNFGRSVAVSNTGDIALVGGKKPMGAGASNIGVVHVFIGAVDGTWSHEAELVDPGAQLWDDNLGSFGDQVALSADGTTALIGAEFTKRMIYVCVYTENQVTCSWKERLAAGMAHVFTRAVDGAWSHQAELPSPTGGEDQVFGSSVALSDSGDTAVVGESGMSIGAAYFQGAAHVFTRDAAGAWSHQQQLSRPNTLCPSSDQGFGNSVAIEASGTMALVGARFRCTTDPYSPTEVEISSGAAFLFKMKPGGTWVYQHELLARDRASMDSLGVSSALSSSGETAVVGALSDDRAAGSGTGAAYVFDLSDGDADGLLDAVETNTGVYVDADDTGTDPAAPDSDNDGLLDGAETGTGTYVAIGDTGTDPTQLDSDGDGFDDGLEVTSGSDPNDFLSTPVGAEVPVLMPLAFGLLATLLGLIGVFRVGVFRGHQTGQ